MAIFSKVIIAICYGVWKTRNPMPLSYKILHKAPPKQKASGVTESLLQLVPEIENKSAEASNMPLLNIFLICFLLFLGLLVFTFIHNLQKYKKRWYYQNNICIFAPNLKTKHKLLTYESILSFHPDGVGPLASPCPAQVQCDEGN